MSVTHPKFKAAAVQASPVFLDLDKTVDKSIALIKEAASKGASLIAFPETFIPGYPWFIWLDSPAWGMQFVQRYHDNSLVYGSPQADRLAKAAKDNNIMVVMGHSEKQGGSLYMGQWIIGPDGRDHRDAAQAEAHACRTYRVRRRRRLRPVRVRHRARPCRRAVLLGASATAVEVRDVRAERAGACRRLAELLALSRRRLCARTGGQQCRDPHLCGRRRLLRRRALRGGFKRDDRHAVRRRHEEAPPARRAAASRRFMRRTAS